MNKKHIYHWIGLLVLTALPLQAAVTVEWVKPESFRDAKGDAADSARGRASVLDQLQRSFTHLGTKHLPGYNLALKVTQLDLAGDYLPSRTSAMDDVRIIKDSFPARIEFTYKLTDSTGALVKEGTESLSSMSDTRPFNADSEPYAWTSQMMEQWMRQLARDLKKK